MTPREELAARFAKLGYSAPQNVLADTALEWFRAYLEREETVERAASEIYAVLFGGGSGPEIEEMCASVARDHARAALRGVLEGWG